MLTKAGGVCYFYPVNEFVPDKIPTSDTDGRMVFHHVANYLEFGGREYRNLIGIRFGETRAPQYACVFSVGGREVYRAWYDDLRWRGRDDLPKTTTTWTLPDWPVEEFEAHRDAWEAHRRRMYDCNGDGELDREERTADWYFESVGLEPLDPSGDKRYTTFAVVEQTVTVSVP